MITTDWLFNIVGAVGAVLLIFGFYRVNSGRWSNKSFWYELDNLVGAICLMVYQIYHAAYIALLVNVTWSAVALWGIIIFFKRLHTHRKRRKT